MRTRLTATAIGLLLLAGLPAEAESQTTTIQATAIADGGTAVVSGVADILAPEGPIDVGGTSIAFAGAGTPAGDAIELTGAEIELLGDGLRFTWHVADLPEVVPPEGVRYTWSFAAGGQTYQLQAKRSNVASITTAEDPVGHAQQAATTEDWFQLRGACQESYQGAPVSGCYHLAFLDGAFDPVADTVTMEMPFDTRDGIGRLVGETFRRGVQITAVETAAASIAGSFQAVVSNNSTSSVINGWEPVFTGPVVELAVGRPGLNPAAASYSTTATLNPDGTFSGTVSGLTAANSAVYARACHGLRSACTAVAVPLG